MSYRAAFQERAGRGSSHLCVCRGAEPQGLRRRGRRLQRIQTGRVTGARGPGRACGLCRGREPFWAGWHGVCRRAPSHPWARARPAELGGAGAASGAGAARPGQAPAPLGVNNEGARRLPHRPCALAVPPFKKRSERYTVLLSLLRGEPGFCC